MSRPARTLVVLCPDWPITAAFRPVDEAVAVIEAGRVVALSPLARSCGLREGQRRKEAESFCEGLVVLRRDLPAELRAFEAVVGALQGFGVEVFLRQPGWASAPTKGPARRLGGEAGLGDAVAQSVAAVLSAAPFVLHGQPPAAGELIGEGWRIGIGDGPFAATLAARLGRIVASEETATFLADWPIEVLARPKLTSTLKRLGLHTLGSFAALPAGDVLARFGSDGARAHELAAGKGSGGGRRQGRISTYAATVEFDPPVEQVEPATFAARGLAEELCASLEHDGRSASLLVIEVTTSEGEQLLGRWSHDGPWNAQLMADRLRWQLDAWLGRQRAEEADGVTIPRGIERVRIVAEEVVAATGRQDRLFGRSGVGDERVERVVARVQGMLGPAGVQQAFLVGGRGPADRVRLVPFGEPPPKATSPELPWPGQLPSPNPAAVFSVPLQVELLGPGGEPVRVDGRGGLSATPSTLLFGRERLPVAAWAGPWPVDEHWWAKDGRRRRARLQLVTADGAGFLVGIENGSWLLEGCYD